MDSLNQAWQNFDKAWHEFELAPTGSESQTKQKEVSQKLGSLIKHLSKEHGKSSDYASYAFAVKISHDLLKTIGDGDARKARGWAEVFHLDKKMMEKVIGLDALEEIYPKIEGYMPHPKTEQGWSQVELEVYSQLFQATAKADAIVQDLISENTPESLKAAKEIAKKVIEKMGGEASAQKLREELKLNYDSQPLARLIELSRPTTTGEKVKAKVEQVQKRVTDALSFGKKEKPS